MKLGILRIDPRSGNISEVGIRVFLQLFSIIGYILRSDRCVVFGILNYRSSLFTLSIISVLFIFSFLALSQSDMKYAVQQEFYCKAVLSVSIIRHNLKIYTTESAEGVFILIIVQST